jgi:MFS family permease
VSAETGIDASLKRARAALFVAFGAQGFSLIAVTSEIPTLEKRLHIGDSTVAIVLACVLVFAAVGSLAAGALVGRFGSRIVLRVSQLLVLGAVVGIGAAHALGAAVPFMLLFGAAVGGVDATTNMQAVALQRRYGRSIILSFHGMWAFGAAIGSIAATLATNTHTSLLVFYVSANVPLATVLLAVGRLLLQGVKDETIAIDAATGKPPVIAWRPMLAVCVVMALAYFADSTVSSAGGLYIQDGLHGHGWQITIVYFAYAVPFMIGRFGGDRLTERFGGAPVGRAGAAVAALGFVIAVAAPEPMVALLGFGVVGLGISVMAPLCFSAAGRLDPAETGVAVARLNIFNYVGFLFGSALVTGLWGAGVPHRAGLVVPLVAAAGIAAFAFGFGEQRTAAYFASGQPTGRGRSSDGGRDSGSGLNLSEATPTPNAH